MRRKNGSFHIKTRDLNALTSDFHPKSVFGFLVRRRSESKFAPTRREKRSVAALHEYFRNEVGVNFGHLQRE
jgi:hypothetical protein